MEEPVDFTRIESVQNESDQIAKRTRSSNKNKPEVLSITLMQNSSEEVASCNKNEPHKLSITKIPHSSERAASSNKNEPDKSSNEKISRGFHGFKKHQKKKVWRKIYPDYSALYLRSSFLTLKQKVLSAIFQPIRDDIMSKVDSLRLSHNYIEVLENALQSIGVKVEIQKQVFSKQHELVHSILPPDRIKSFVAQNCVVSISPLSKTTKLHVEARVESSSEEDDSKMDSERSVERVVSNCSSVHSHELQQRSAQPIYEDISDISQDNDLNLSQNEQNEIETNVLSMIQLPASVRITLLN